jgi:zinc-binding alcohol dehydrogenase/oxidoreductase
MKAAILENIKQPLQIKEIETPEPGIGEALIQIKAAALNHRDIYISQGLYAGIKTPVILGSDGSGIVVKVGSEKDNQWLNQAVIINPNIDWGDNLTVQSRNYNILGMPSNGTLAEYVCVKMDRLHPKPDFMNFEEAAAMPLAGLTAYRALFTKAGLNKNDRLFISGIGGGVALTALQMALATGTEVWVSSGSEDKINTAMEIGAKGGINYKTENWHKLLIQKAGSGFDVILDSAGGEGFGLFLDIANPAARIVFYGGTKGNFTLNPQKMFWKQISMYGSTMGSDEDFRKMLELYNQYKIKPMVKEIFNLNEINKAFELIDAGKQFGKIIIKP